MLKEYIKSILENLSEDEIKNVPIAKKLNVIYNYPEIKLTKTGNFPIKIVKELVDTGIFMNIPENIKEDYIFEVKLFKNLLVASRLFRKSKNKLVQTKKYQKLSLKEKVLKLFEALDITTILDSVFLMDWYVSVSFKDFFLHLVNIDKFLITAIACIDKEKELKENVLLSVLFEFGLFRDGKLLIDVKIKKIKTDEIIELEDINEKVAKLFLVAILEDGICETCDDDEILIIQKIYNTLEKFAFMNEGDEEWHYKWLRKMGRNLEKNISIKVMDLLMMASTEVSDEVREDIIQVLVMYMLFNSMNKKEKDDFLMFLAMTICEIYLNKYYNLFEG